MDLYEGNGMRARKAVAILGVAVGGLLALGGSGAVAAKHHGHAMKHHGHAMKHGGAMH
jgi:hypothetical protein